jgi:hypothetical protein
MIPVKKLSSGDLVTRDWLQSVADAIMELQNKAILRAEFPLVISPGGTISQGRANVAVVFLPTSNADPGDTYRRYNAQLIVDGTPSGTETHIFENGAEPVSIFSSNQLLVSPNTSTFGVMGAGVIDGADPTTGKPIIRAWMGFAGC